MGDLDAIFKAYDIRGLVPDQSTPTARRSALRSPLRRRREPPVSLSLVARDMRPSGVELTSAFTDGVTDQGARRDRPRPGVDRSRSTSPPGRLDAPGAMFTASHNPAEYNGIKLCLAERQPVGEDTGLGEIKATGGGGDVPPGAAAAARVPSATCSRTSPPTSGRSSTPTSLRPLKVVADTANGMGGLVVPEVFDRPAVRSWRSCSASSTAPSPTTRPTPSSPRTSRPAGPGPGGGRRRRPRLRRRRRPRLPRRRAGRAHVGVDSPPRWSPQTLLEKDPGRRRSSTT